MVPDMQDDSTGWISYGVRSQAWVLRLNYSSKKKGRSGIVVLSIEV